VKIDVVHTNKLGKEKAKGLISENYLKLKHLRYTRRSESDTILISGRAKGAKFDEFIKISEPNIVIDGELSGLSVMFFTQKTVEDFVPTKLTEFGL
jgi:hypothetical protein